MKSIIRIGLIIIVVLIFTSIYQCQNIPKNYLISNLPTNAKIKNIHFETCSINGDYLVVAKIYMTEKEFHEFTKVLKLKSSSDKPPNFITKELSFEWWVAPSNRNDVVYRSGDSFQLWSFYKEGFAYYCDKGW